VASGALIDPRGIWSDGTNLYVADITGSGGTIKKVVMSSGAVTTLAGSVPGGFGPNGLWGDEQNLYIADFDKHVIRKLRLSDNQLSVFAGTAGLSCTTECVNGVGTAATFGRPESVWGDGTFLYVVSGFDTSIRKINLQTAEVSTLTGTAGVSDFVGGVYYNGIWGNGQALFVSDVKRYVIRKITASAASGGGSFTLTVDHVGTGTGNITITPGVCGNNSCPLSVVSGAFTFSSGTVVTLSGTPDTGSTFSGWTGACTNTTGSCTVTMNANKSVNAKFDVTSGGTIFNLTVNKSGTGTGTVTSSPSGINCGTTACAFGFSSGTVVTLTATPNTGSTFAGWSGACTNASGTCTLTMSQAQNVTASFTAASAASPLFQVAAGAITSGLDIVVPAPAGNPALNVTQIGAFDVGASSFSTAPAAVELARGQTKEVVLSGAGIKSALGSTFTISGSGLALSNIRFQTGPQSQDLVIATVAVDANAVTGPRYAMVRNTNDDISILSGGLIIK
jgi:hypothetical protein